MEGICVSCGKTKVKRWCPVLNNQICSLCCGKKRKIEINCPQNCSYLVKGELYELQKGPQKEILEKEIPSLITGEEFLKRYVDPKEPTKIDYFVFEIANIAGSIVEKSFLEISNLSISPKILIDQLIKNIIPVCYEEVNKCYECKFRCPIIYNKDGSLAFKQHILKDGISIKNLPEELQEQTLGNFFAIEFSERLTKGFKNEINKLSQEDKIGLSEKEIHDLAGDFYWAVMIFISECFYCDTKCPAKPKKSGICYFCQQTDRYKNLCVYGAEFRENRDGSFLSFFL